MSPQFAVAIVVANVWIATDHAAMGAVWIVVAVAYSIVDKVRSQS